MQHYNNLFTFKLILVVINFPEFEAFLTACKHGQYEAAESLLKEPHLHINAYGHDGLSALMCASQEGHYKVVKLLLENGARVDLQDSKGWSALMYACEKGHHEVMRLLLEHGADVDLQSVQWESACSLALHHDHPEMLILIEEKVGLTRNDYYLSLIHI